MLSEVPHELSVKAHLRNERVFQRDIEHGASSLPTRQVLSKFNLRLVRGSMIPCNLQDQYQSPAHSF